MLPVSCTAHPIYIIFHILEVELLSARNHKCCCCHIIGDCQNAIGTEICWFTLCCRVQKSTPFPNGAYYCLPRPVELVTVTGFCMDWLAWKLLQKSSGAWNWVVSPGGSAERPFVPMGVFLHVLPLQDILSYTDVKLQHILRHSCSTAKHHELRVHSC